MRSMRCAASVTHRHRQDVRCPKCSLDAVQVASVTSNAELNGSFIEKTTSQFSRTIQYLDRYLRQKGTSRLPLLNRLRQQQYFILCVTCSALCLTNRTCVVRLRTVSNNDYVNWTRITYTHAHTNERTNERKKERKEKPRERKKRRWIRKVENSWCDKIRNRNSAIFNSTRNSRRKRQSAKHKSAKSVCVCVSAFFSEEKYSNEWRERAKFKIHFFFHSQCISL